MLQQIEAALPPLAAKTLAAVVPQHSFQHIAVSCLAFVARPPLLDSNSQAAKSACEIWSCTELGHASLLLQFKASERRGSEALPWFAYPSSQAMR
jgi:hypothetical protein